MSTIRRDLPADSSGLDLDNDLSTAGCWLWPHDEMNLVFLVVCTCEIDILVYRRLAVSKDSEVRMLKDVCRVVLLGVKGARHGMKVALN